MRPSRLACILITTAVLGIGSGASAAAPQPAARLSHLTVTATGDGLVVTIRATSRLAPRVIAARPGPPAAVFLDLRGVDPGVVPGTTTGKGTLRRVVVERTKDPVLTTRVVLELNRPMAYLVKTPEPDGSELQILLHEPQAAPPGQADAEPTPSQKPSPLVSAAIAAQAASGAGAPSATSAWSTRPGTAAGSPTGGTSALAAKAAAPRPWGRASFYAHGARTRATGRSPTSYGEFVSSLTYQFTDRETDGIEYGVDLRHAGYTLQGQDPRLSIYDGYAGVVLRSGSVRLRGGQMWLNDLGALGTVAGGLVEFRQRPNVVSPFGRWRFGVFGGLEPKVYDTGYAAGVRKFGTYAALDAARNRRHVLGYVNVRNASLSERSVMTFTNFLPLGPALFIYQAGEYDLTGPAGQGSGGLTYFFTNARVTASRRVEVLGTFNRGRSIDARRISEDLRAGRPLSQRDLEGLHYESLGGRVTVEVWPRVRVYAGYSRDRTNRDDASTGRWLVGGHAWNIVDSGFDVTVSDSRIERPTGAYHATYVSVGRQIGRQVYVSGDYTNSLSIVRFTGGDGVAIEFRPRTHQFGGSGTINLGRSYSLLFSLEHMQDEEVEDLRFLSGLTYRIR